jgi:uncharacterized protein YyaL (SSP411 family)
LARLAAIRNDGELLARAKKTVNAFARQLAHFPSALPQMLVAFDFLEGSPRQLVIAGDSGSPETEGIADRSASAFFAEQGPALGRWRRGPEVSRRKERGDPRDVDGGRKTCSVRCENFACKAPVTDVDEFRDLLTT